MNGIVRWLGMMVAKRDDSRGQLLIEVLIALALLGMIATVFIGAMYTALHSARIADERSIAVTLAKSEIEYVKEQPFSTSPWIYVVDTTAPYVTGGTPDFALPPSLSGDDFEGYSVLVTGEGVDLDGTGGDDVGIWKVTAEVLHNDTTVLSLENYRLDR